MFLLERAISDFSFPPAFADLEKILEKNPKISQVKITFLCLVGGLLLPLKFPIKTFGKLNLFPPNLLLKT